MNRSRRLIAKNSIGKNGLIAYISLEETCGNKRKTNIIYIDSVFTLRVFNSIFRENFDRQADFDCWMKAPGLWPWHVSKLSWIKSKYLELTLGHNWPSPIRINSTRKFEEFSSTLAYIFKHYSYFIFLNNRKSFWENQIYWFFFWTKA